MSYINDNEITYVVLESSSKILWCDHSNGTSQPYFVDVICSFVFFFILLQNDSSRGNRNLSLEPEVESINCTFA